MAAARKTQRAISNEAQRLLEELGVTLGQLAGTTEKSRQAASAWMKGEKRPDDDARKAIAARWPEVDTSLWEKLPQGRQAPAADAPSPPAEPPKPDETDFRTKMVAHLADVETQMVKALQEDRMGDWIKLGSLKEKIVLGLAKFTGELNAADETRLTKTKRFIEVRTAIAKALAPFPEAGKAVESALKALGA